MGGRALSHEKGWGQDFDGSGCRCESRGLEWDLNSRCASICVVLHWVPQCLPGTRHLYYLFLALIVRAVNRCFGTKLAGGEGGARDFRRRITVYSRKTVWFKLTLRCISFYFGSLRFIRKSCWLEVQAEIE